MLKENNNDEDHVKALTGKANVILGKIRGIEESLFKDHWKERMFLFDSIIKGVILFGAEIWGWKAYKG